MRATGTRYFWVDTCRLPGLPADRKKEYREKRLRSVMATMPAHPDVFLWNVDTFAGDALIGFSPLRVPRGRIEAEPVPFDSPILDIVCRRVVYVCPCSQPHCLGAGVGTAIRVMKCQNDPEPIADVITTCYGGCGIVPVPVSQLLPAVQLLAEKNFLEVLP